MGNVEPDNLGSLYEQFAGRLMLYARQFLADDHAGDCVQQVFLKLVSDEPDIRDIQAWLFRAVRNAALDRIKAEKRRRNREQYVAQRRSEWFQADPGSQLEAAETRKALEKLPSEMREVVVMKFWGQLSLRQIAEVIERPATTTARMYYNALVRLKLHLD